MTGRGLLALAAAAGLAGCGALEGPAFTERAHEACKKPARGAADGDVTATRRRHAEALEAVRGLDAAEAIRPRVGELVDALDEQQRALAALERGGGRSSAARRYSQARVIEVSALPLRTDPDLGLRRCAEIPAPLVEHFRDRAYGVQVRRLLEQYRRELRTARLDLDSTDPGTLEDELSRAYFDAFYDDDVAWEALEPPRRLAKSHAALGRQINSATYALGDAHDALKNFGSMRKAQVHLARHRRAARRLREAERVLLAQLRD